MSKIGQYIQYYVEGQDEEKILSVLKTDMQLILPRDNDMDISEAREKASQMIPDVPDTMFVMTNDTKVNGAERP